MFILFLFFSWTYTDRIGSQANEIKHFIQQTLVLHHKTIKYKLYLHKLLLYNYWLRWGWHKDLSTWKSDIHQGRADLIKVQKFMS